MPVLVWFRLCGREQGPALKPKLYLKDVVFEGSITISRSVSWVDFSPCYRGNEVGDFLVADSEPSIAEADATFLASSDCKRTCDSTGQLLHLLITGDLAK